MPDMKPRSLIMLAFLSLIAFQVGCSSSSSKDANSARGLFEIAKELEEDELYEQALQKYAEVRNKHPYSRYAVQAELRIADVHFKRENYEEAQIAYQIFKDLHPKHPQIAYVTHRLALCYFHRLPSTIDRDLGQANRAILYFNEVLSNFPRSKYAKEAKKKRDEVQNMLAAKELYIADFYYKRDSYNSALLRYKYLVKNFPNSDLMPKALLRGSISAAEIGEKEESRTLIGMLLKRFTNSEEAADAEKVIKKYDLR